MAIFFIELRHVETVCFVAALLAKSVINRAFYQKYLEK